MRDNPVIKASPLRTVIGMQRRRFLARGRRWGNGAVSHPSPPVPALDTRGTKETSLCNGTSQVQVSHRY